MKKFYVWLSIFLSLICVGILRHSDTVPATAGRASIATAEKDTTKLVLIAAPVAPANPCDDYWNLHAGKSLSVERQHWFNYLDAPGYFRFHIACAKHWDGTQFACADEIIRQESGWNHNADNPGSSAFGIGQLLWDNRVRFLRDNPHTRDPRMQSRGTAEYMQAFHDSPCEALRIKRRTGIY